MVFKLCSVSFLSLSEYIDGLRWLSRLSDVLPPLRACLYDPGVPGRLGVLGSRLVDNLLLFSRLRLYGDRDVPVEATETVSVKRDKLCPYKRNIPVHRDEVK